MKIDAQVLADAAGVSLTSYYRFEDGTRRCYFDKVCCMADAMGVSTDMLRRDPEAPAIAAAEADGTVVPPLEGWGDVHD